MARWLDPPEADAVGLELDALVAAAEGVEPSAAYRPSSEWATGGPLIERECIELIYYGTETKHPWEAQIGCNCSYIDQSIGDAIGGSTPLEAAMRAYVISKKQEIA